MLTEDKRQQLDSIVQQMVQNREPDDAVQFVVNDFKNKYDIEEPEESFLEKTEKTLDMLFGGGKIGEAIGTGLAKTKVGRKLVGAPELSEEEEKTIQGPSTGEVAGSALQSAALFTPAGTLAKGITAGVRGMGLVKGASALGKIGSGVIAGELFDIASNLQQGKVGKEALTPGIGALIGGAIPAAGVAKNITVRFGEKEAPRVINSLIKPLAKDFSYGKNPGRAVAEEGIVANNFDDLIEQIKTNRQRIGQEIGELGDTLSDKPIIQLRAVALKPFDEAIKTATSQNNSTVLNRLNNVKRAITEVLEPTIDDAGNLGIKSVGSRNLDNLTFKQVRNILTEIGDMTQFTGNFSDDKLINATLKKVYGSIKDTSLKYAQTVNPSLAQDFSKLTEKYADLQSAEISARYRDKIIERQSLIGFSPQIIGAGGALITAIATGGAAIPSLVVGMSAALADKLAQTPGFKTRLAYILSKKTHQEANYLFQKIPALSRIFGTPKGIFPGDILLGEQGGVLAGKIGEFIKKPKLGLSIEDVSKTEFKGFKDLTTKFLDYAKGKTTLSRQEIMDFARRPEVKKADAELTLRKLEEFEPSNPLAQEARKFKSVEEFVKAQKPIYHGTTKAFDKFDPELSPGGSAWFTDSRKALETGADVGLNRAAGETVNIMDRYIKPGLKLVDRSTKEGKKLADDLMTGQLESQGYRGIIHEADAKRGRYVELFYPNEDALTKSQLTDFYNQAVRGTGKIPAQEFADSIRRDLLELKPVKIKDPQYRGTTYDINANRGGKVEGKNYEEVVFESPITTNGSSHYPNSKNYFAHARGDRIVLNGKKIYRQQEIQSDALQKGRLENEIRKLSGETGLKYKDEFVPEMKAKAEQLKRLEPFTNDRFGERIMREMIKRQAKAGDDKYWLPTGETIGKIEGFEGGSWYTADNFQRRISPDSIKIGQEVTQQGGGNHIGDSDRWIITDILGDGRFKAVPANKTQLKELGLEEYVRRYPNSQETFDLTGKSNPQYRRYSDWGKFLKNKYGGKEVTDPQGNTWIEIDLKPEHKRMPVEAFGLAPFIGFGSEE